MIEPFEDRQVRAGVVSFGLSSYGYDTRVADEFKVFTNVYNTVVDPKKFDPRSFVDIKSDCCIVPPNSFALARTIEYFRIPARRLDGLPGQVHLRALRDHRQRHAVRARVGGPRDHRDFEHDAASGQDLRQRRASPRCCSSRATSRARSRTRTRRASTRRRPASLFQRSKRRKAEGRKCLVSSNDSAIQRADARDQSVGLCRSQRAGHRRRGDRAGVVRLDERRDPRRHQPHSHRAAHQHPGSDDGPRDAGDAPDDHRRRGDDRSLGGDPRVHDRRPRAGRHGGRAA